jgi:hypothetical protein
VALWQIAQGVAINQPLAVTQNTDMIKSGGIFENRWENTDFD